VWRVRRDDEVAYIYLRNTKVVDIITALRGYHTQVDVHDPWVDIEEARHEYGLHCLPTLPQLAATATCTTAAASAAAAPEAESCAPYDAVILAVGHHQFTALGPAGIKALARPNAVVYDVKSILPLGAADGRL